ncbi:glutamate--cysteine ligase [Raineyella fluvialis]|uniref:Putative glutamate--cysteine ligase 2 n=1 Tax=Raineyella fluvialis TaxID=2662261 RepID=A0A5Q2FAU2_9ACTN|nr:glutamate--cysteine ligase [Raineyella fluvialis]QGF23511.1 YbdK family carboxylate-amine ligase [Raineyella fluvialis]
MRRYGVEEELLVVDAETLEPLPSGGRAADDRGEGSASETQLTAELQQEQIEAVSPPMSTLSEQWAAIRRGRALAQEAAARFGGVVVALPLAPARVTPHLVAHPRYQRMLEQFGPTAAEQLTNGFHVHVEIGSRAEGVGVLDRIRVWLPAVLALSANSPFSGGADTGYASYRYQAWSRWPTAGPTDLFGSPDGYDRHRAALLATKVPLDAGMLYFDARLAEKYSTVEVRVADVNLDAEHAAVIASLIRALVETGARAWRNGDPAPDVPASELSVWNWRASRSGIEDQLVDPRSGTPVPAAEVIGQFLELVRPALADDEERMAVETVVDDILHTGGGARRQRRAYEAHHRLRDVVACAVDATHAPARRR